MRRLTSSSSSESGGGATPSVRWRTFATKTFTNASYTALIERQIDDNIAYGGRLGAQRALSPGLAVGLEASAATARLTERPPVIARLRLAYAAGAFSAYGEAERIGGVFSLDGQGRLVSLDGATLANFGADYALGDAGVAIYARASNAFDAFYEPQAGLPADGRRVTLGVRASL